MDSAIPDPEDALIARVAWLYYHDGLTQNDIGAALNLTRIKVSRLLDQGREAGLIQIRVNSLHHGCLELEGELSRRFALADCRVIPEGSGAPEARLGAAAAQFMMETLKPGDLLAVGWGETVSQTIRRLGHFAQAQSLGLVSLTGGVSTYVEGVRRANWGDQVFILPSPLAASTPELGAALLAEPAVARLLDMAVRASCKLVGIGGVNAHSTVVTQGVIARADVEPLRRMGAVGDILCRFYDADGRQLDLPLHRRVVGLDLPALKDSDRVVGVAGGPEKVEPIRAALRGGLLNILITDEPTALSLLFGEEA